MNSKNKNLKLIIVDDNETFRKVARNFLESEYQYHILEDVSDATQFFSLKNLHLANIILMDLQMPGRDGYFITRDLLKDYSFLKVIAITMHTDKAYLNELIRVGFKGCVFKPDFYRNIKNAIEAVECNRYFFPQEIKL